MEKSKVTTLMFPVCEELTPSIADLPRLTKNVDKEPEELQRGEVASDSWGSWVIVSILLGVKLPPMTWSVQKKPYFKQLDSKTRIKCHIKNIDGLQRQSKIELYNGGMLSLPKDKVLENVKWEFSEDYDYGESLNISGMDVHQLKDTYPEFYEERWLNYKLRIDKYGTVGNYLTKAQETYLFKQVLNNGNKMNGQQWRNPTVSEIAAVIRRDARLKPIELFKPLEYIGGQSNKKMEYDELLAEIYHWIMYGTTQTASKAGLDSMYESPLLADDLSDVPSSNHKIGKNINLRDKVTEVTDMMLEILKDKKAYGKVDKAMIRSLFMFCYLHITELGNSTKYDYREVKKTFHQGHSEMIDTSSLPPGTPETVFGNALAYRSTKHRKIVARMWREYLGWSIDTTYEE